MEGLVAALLMAMSMSKVHFISTAGWVMFTSPFLVPKLLVNCYEEFVYILSIFGTVYLHELM